MKEQNTKGNVESKELSRNRKRRNRILKRSINRKRPERKQMVSAAPRNANKVMKEHIPPEISKLCKNLKAKCIKLEKAEKENQKLIRKILKDVRQKKKELFQFW
jgi:vacuolar-type H+-ATPase subunit H